MKKAKTPKVKKLPQRKCLGCGLMKDKKALLRVVRTPQGEVKLDLSGKQNGRGAYVCPAKDCIAKAVKSKALERALEQSIDQAVYARLLAELPAEAPARDGPSQEGS